MTQSVLIRFLPRLSALLVSTPLATTLPSLSRKMTSHPQSWFSCRFVSGKGKFDTYKGHMHQRWSKLERKST